MSERKKVATEIGLIGLVCVIIIVAIMLPWSWDEDIAPLPPRPAQFTDLVQTSVKGVVHLQCPSWQGSGFVVGPKHIITARHCVDDVEDFLITTWDEHQIKATRAVSHKKSDTASIWVDDLGCVNKDYDHRIEHGGEHEVSFRLLRLGSIKDCRLGQSVYAIGSSLGKQHFNNLTTGVISSTLLDVESFGCPESFGWATLFHVDAATYGGNSGCPIFTMDGVVRGVLVGGPGNYESISYTIPCDLFLEKIPIIALKFALDEYQREEEVIIYDTYYNYEDGNEYY